MLEFLAGFLACAAVVLFWHAYLAYKEHKAVEAYKKINMHPGREGRISQQARARFIFLVDKRGSLQ